MQTVTGLMIAGASTGDPDGARHAERRVLGLPDPGHQLCADHRRHDRPVPAAPVRSVEFNNYWQPGLILAGLTVVQLVWARSSSRACRGAASTSTRW
ncbi:MAG: hypothetical protein WDN45_13670 [Caulobacteraceae bacterium]